MRTAGLRAAARVLLCVFIGLPISALACEVDCLSRAALSTVADAESRPAANRADPGHHRHHLPAIDPSASDAAAVDVRDSGRGGAEPRSAGLATLQSDPPDCALPLTAIEPSPLPDRHVPSLPVVLTQAAVIGCVTVAAPAIVGHPTASPIPAEVASPVLRI